MTYSKVHIAIEEIVRSVINLIPSNGIKCLIKSTEGINKRLVTKYFMVVLEKIENSIASLFITIICKIIIKISAVAVVIIQSSGVNLPIETSKNFIETLYNPPI